MKKSVILLVLAFLTFGLVNAQNTAMRGSVEKRAQKQAQSLKKKLSLTSEQYGKIYELVHDNIQQIDLLKEEMKTKHGEEGERYNEKKLRILRLEIEKEMKSILTSDQYKKWQKDRAKKTKTVKDKNNEIEIVESENIF
ncbi:MAG: hypothetical protein PHY85_02390 [Bacteroidales bacterium]|nr:hypothetical protein [Bacteroidales bacterium]